MGRLGRLGKTRRSTVLDRDKNHIVLPHLGFGKIEKRDWI